MTLDVSDATFQTDVIDRSATATVVAAPGTSTESEAPVHAAPRPTSSAVHASGVRNVM